MNLRLPFLTVLAPLALSAGGGGGGGDPVAPDAAVATPDVVDVAVVDALASNETTLTAEVQSRIGTDVPFICAQPQLAGSLAMTPDACAKLLRKMLSGGLRIGALLGTGPVCTNPLTCGTDQAVFSRSRRRSAATTRSPTGWKTTPGVGDAAFSSPGAFGFYPWIDASKTCYGVLARVAQNGAFPSVQCGRLIRKAWMTGTAR